MPRTLLTLFQCITMEGWTDIMYQLQDSFEPTVVAFYFSLLIVFGAFFAINLTLAVLESNFDHGGDKDHNKEEKGDDDGGWEYFYPPESEPEENRWEPPTPDPVAVLFYHSLAPLATRRHP